MRRFFPKATADRCAAEYRRLCVLALVRVYFAMRGALQDSLLGEMEEHGFYWMHHVARAAGWVPELGALPDPPSAEASAAGSRIIGKLPRRGMAALKGATMWAMVTAIKNCKRELDREIVRYAVSDGAAKARQVTEAFGWNADLMGANPLDAQGEGTAAVLN